MFKKIKKRDGKLVKFDSQKITQAVLKAGEETGEFGEKRAKKLTVKVLNVAQEIIDKKNPTVEELQDIVEEVLLSSSFKKTAKAYIIYREQHAKLRDMIDQNHVQLVDQYLQRADWQVKENSNMAYSLQGLNNYISTEISRMYWLNKIYTPKLKKAHLSGDLHIHDLNLLSVYCVGWDLMDVLTQGFKGVPGKIESKPAKHFRTALGQIVNFFYTLQGEAAGAQAFSNFDTLLAPFIYYDKLTKKEIKQALQEFVFNVNVPTRVGFQTPFTNISMDLTVPSTLAKQPVIIGGKPQKKKYKDFQKEMDLINRCLMEVMMEGDAKGRVFTFPIPTYSITKDFDWNNKTLEPLWESTAKYGIPYFSNFVNSDLNPEDARSMCCRLRLDTRKLEKRGGGLFGANPLTGSIGIVTLNLARLGYTSKNEKQYFEKLEKLINLAKESLEIKRKTLERLTDIGLYPYTKFYLRHIKERFDQYWKNHFSTIGVIGMHESCLNLIDAGIETQKGKKFAMKVMDYIREKMVEFQKETGNNYNLEATPAEGTTYRLASLDKKKYPDMVFSSEELSKKEVAPFYTNSTQLPVDYSEDIFEVLDHQDNLQVKYTGGTVVHLFAGERIDNNEVVKNLVKKICSQYELPYFTISPTFSICPEHGYLVGEHSKCPECGAQCEVYSRVVGFLRPVGQWNDGKQQEFMRRSLFKMQ